MAAPTPTRVTHLIVELKTGGAEKSLLRLVDTTRNHLEHRVFCLGPVTDIGRAIEACGVPVVWFDYRALGLARALWRALRWLRRDPPDVLQGWMYFGNVLASAFGLSLRRRQRRRMRIAWNIRQSPDDFAAEKAITRVAINLARLPVMRPDLVIYNSHAGLRAHSPLGVRSGRNVVITNGIDPTRYAPDAGVRGRVRTCHGLPPGNALPWVAMVCRYHPLKGVDVYLRAVRTLLDERPGCARFSLVGPGMQAENEALRADMAAARVSVGEVTPLGPVADSADFLPGLDVLVLASHREGTPNILLEAMACGVTAVATRVGDAPRILDDAARLVRVGDADDLAQKIRYALDHLGQWCERDRALIAQHYHIDACMQAYLQAYEELVG